MVRTINKIALLTVFFLGALSLNAAKLEIDKGHSEVGFKIKHLMISNVKGKFTKFNADLAFDTHQKIFTQFDATVDPSSIDTGIEKRDNHLRSPDFFDVKKYPEMTFRMTSYKANADEGVLKGNLTIHGVTQPVKLKVEFNGTIKDPWGGTRAGFTIEGKINRKDFGLTWNKALEAGGVVVGDEVKLMIELETHVK